MPDLGFSRTMHLAAPSLSTGSRLFCPANSSGEHRNSFGDLRRCEGFPTSTDWILSRWGPQGSQRVCRPAGRTPASILRASFPTSAARGCRGGANSDVHRWKELFRCSALEPWGPMECHFLATGVLQGLLQHWSPRARDFALRAAVGSYPRRAQDKRISSRPPTYPNRKKECGECWSGMPSPAPHRYSAITYLQRPLKRNSLTPWSGWDTSSAHRSPHAQGNLVNFAAPSTSGTTPLVCRANPTD